MGYPTDRDFEEARYDRRPPAARVAAREDRVTAILAEVTQRFPAMRMELQADFVDGTDAFRRRLIGFILEESERH